MTTLNWEKDRAKRHIKEHSFDDLPRAGSFQDQIRYGALPWTSVRRDRHASPAASQVGIRNRTIDFDQLSRYLQHALHTDFKRKLDFQKNEVIEIIKKLILRCEAWGHGLPSREAALLNNARSAIKNLCH